MTENLFKVDFLKEVLATMSWGYWGPMGDSLTAEVVEERNISLEASPSSAASCRACKGKIGLGSLRVARGGRFWHLRCYKPLYEGRVALPEDYFVSGGHCWDEKQQAQIEGWKSKWNTKARERSENLEPGGVEAVVPVAHIAAAPGGGGVFSSLSTDTMVAILAFLDERELATSRRVCKAFLRGADALYRRRYFALHPSAQVSPLIETSYYHLWIHGLCHGCQVLLGDDSVLIALLRRRVCHKCYSQNRSYTCVAKKYLTQYGLTEKDAKEYQIPCETRPNPHGRSLAPMKVYLVWHLEQAKLLKETTGANTSKKRSKLA